MSTQLAIDFTREVRAAESCQHPPAFLRSLPRPHCINCLAHVYQPTKAYRDAEHARVRAVVQQIEAKAAERGKARAAAAHNRDLELARQIARELGRDGRVLCADDVRFEAERRPELGIVWGNFAGSLFVGREWAFVGYTKSTAPGSHSNLLRTWRLKNNA